VTGRGLVKCDVARRLPRGEVAASMERHQQNKGQMTSCISSDPSAMSGVAAHRRSRAAHPPP
jgi:hypothetical protein